MFVSVRVCMDVSVYIYVGLFERARVRINVFVNIEVWEEHNVGSVLRPTTRNEDRKHTVSLVENLG